MKKPDAKRQRPGLQRGFESLQDDDSAKVARVIKRLTGKTKASETVLSCLNFGSQLRRLLMKSLFFDTQLTQKLLRQNLLR